MPKSFGRSHPTGPDRPIDPEVNRVFLAQMAAAAAEAESLERGAHAWRGRSMEELAAELALADAIARGRGFPACKPPLPVIRLRGRPSRLVQ